jgi:hypothetical protein
MAEEISKRLFAPPARHAFAAIAAADPASRYALLKAAAEEVQGRPWDCPAWAKLMAPEKPAN